MIYHKGYNSLKLWPFMLKKVSTPETTSQARDIIYYIIGGLWLELTKYNIYYMLDMSSIFYRRFFDGSYSAEVVS